MLYPVMLLLDVMLMIPLPGTGSVPGTTISFRYLLLPLLQWLAAQESLSLLHIRSITTLYSTSSLLAELAIRE